MTVFYFILAALALGILVFFHELGHYFVAKKMGMVVEVFSIGFGHPLLKWRWQEVNWQLGWLFFGGYVKIKGMELTKKDKKTYVEPYEIPGGFFTKSPWRRICVAAAGPVANFILAFLIFTALFAMGGREKPFSEFTQIVGWVDHASEIYSLGLRPGDILTKYDGKPFTSSKDLLYAAMLGGHKVKLEGFHVNYETGEKSPFDYTIETYQSPHALDDILTTGISSGARYLIYDKFPGELPNPLTEGSPMEESGAQYGDRFVWADGKLLFSMEQLSNILNDNRSLLTIKRGEHTFISRQPRVKAQDLALSAHTKNELTDWQYAANIKGSWQDLKVLPYDLSAQAVVEGPLTFIDAESEEEAFPDYAVSNELERPLKPGDRILAIDGISITTSYQLLDLLQSRHVQLIVERGIPVATKGSWKDADKQFMHSIHLREIKLIEQSIGTKNPITEIGNLQLLRPIKPKPISQFTLTPSAQERLKSEVARQKERIDEMRDQERKNLALEYLEKSQNLLILGISLQDRTVDYNPNPVVLFGSVFTETWQTLRALILGYLHPKWLSGPIGIVGVIHHGWTVGVGEALFWIGAISVNLGFLNLLPIPILDGGYICLSLWELVTRRRLKAKTIERLIIPFVVLLIALLIFLTFQDISRLL